MLQSTRLAVADWFEGHRQASDHTRIRLAPFALVSLQLVLLAVVLYGFHIEESRGFLKIVPLALGGFVVHAWLPKRLQMPFFLLLSLAAFAVFLGPQLAAILIGIGLALFGLCHLPVSYGWRVAALLAACAVLVAIRAAWIPTSWGGVVLPILGSIFMFRIMLYLHHVRHLNKPATLWERLSYFFLLPNACFPIFPVVDYGTFRRTYFNQPAYDIYQKGVLWIFRGVTHLLLYRILYYYFTLAPAQVTTLAEVLQYTITLYLLYLRISGQFHLIIGLLALYGFNLPETHNLYYLASSFNDFWRRINIYWKDFMMKLFFYPVFLRLRKRGEATALAVATLFILVLSWMLHSVQWFWLRGHFPITWVDGIFWCFLGIAVAVNSVLEFRNKQGRRITRPAWNIRRALRHAVQVCTMFVFMSLLWSLWSGTSVGEWLSIMAVLQTTSATEWAVFALAFVGCVSVGVLVQYLNSRGVVLTLKSKAVTAPQEAVGVLAGACVLAILLVPGVVQQLEPTRVGSVLAEVKEARYNQRDAELLERGYYEGLLQAESYTSQLWEIRAEQPRDWQTVREAGIAVPTGTALRYELRPSVDIRFKRAPFQTNAWGMRDQAYPLEKSEGTFRIAFVGKSLEMGGGMPNEGVYEALFEQQLNATYAGQAYQDFEVLNFSVGGYSLLDLLLVTEQKVSPFAPDVLFYAAHSVEARILSNRLSIIMREDVPLPERFEQFRADLGISPDMTQAEVRRLIDPHIDELIRWGYETIASFCNDAGIAPVWVFVPRTEDEGAAYQATRRQLRGYAEAAGFLVLDLEGAYEGHDPRTLELAPWDKHPNALANRLLANQLFQEVARHASQLGIGASSVGTTAEEAAQ